MELKVILSRIAPFELSYPVNPQWNWKNIKYKEIFRIDNHVNPQWNWKLSDIRIKTPEDIEVNPQWNWKFFSLKSMEKAF